MRCIYNTFPAQRVKIESIKVFIRLIRIPTGDLLLQDRMEN